MLSLSLLDWSPIGDQKKNGIGDRKRKKINGRINCNTICSYGSGGTKTLGSAPRLEPKGKINTGSYKIGAFMAFKKRKRSGRDRWFGGWSWEGAAPVRPWPGPGCPHPLTVGPDTSTKHPHRAAFSLLVVSVRIRNRPAILHLIPFTTHGISPM